MVAKDFLKISLLTLLMISTASACSLIGDSQSDSEATIQALSEAISLTATALTSDEVSSEDSVATAQVQATQENISVAATQTALAVSEAQQATATAQAIAPIKAELPKYDVDPNQGQLGWIHPPQVLDIEGYQQYDYANQFMATVARDFVVSADITWNTDYGTSGCGFVLRSDGNQEAPSQYMTLATRGASGHVIFMTMAEGEIVTGQDIYAYGLDPNFQWQNDTTNRLTVVGRGNRFFIYTNDTFIGEIDPSEPPPQPYLPPPPPEPEDKKDTQAMEKYRQKKEEYDDIVKQIKANHAARMNSLKDIDTFFEKGFIAFVAVSESGSTTCQFDNAWLWLIE
jgi:hypothetical protein